MTPEDFMRRAIEVTRAGIAQGQSPFGSVIAQGDRVVAATHNTVWLTTDPTAHAEVNCIRAAAQSLKTIALTGCTLYTTTEPCPMCLSAIHWAKIEKVVFGATIADAAGAGFHELFIDAKDMVRLGRSPLIVESGLLQKECAGLFDEWKAAGKGRAY